MIASMQKKIPKLSYAFRGVINGKAEKHLPYMNFETKVIS